MWRPDLLTDIAAAGLKAHSDALAAEQSVRGLDALAETGFHPILADAFAAAGLGVFREHPYPGQPAKRPKHAERERCDLVLTQTPGAPLLDPVATLKALDAAEGTLFQEAAPAMASAHGGIEPCDAFWIEVKLIAQFCYTRGIPGPNRAYVTELLRIATSDIPKLSREKSIRSSGLLIILFTVDEATATHDLDAFMHRCLDRNLPVASPSKSTFTVRDIVGNQRCTTFLVPVKPVDG